MKRILTLLVLLYGSSALANDTAMGGRGANLVPLKTSDVIMMSEDITLTLEWKGNPAEAGSTRERAKWRAEASYVFKNTGTSKVELQFGFPEYRCETTEPDALEFCPSPKLFHFEDMKTRVRGQEVAHRKGKVDKSHAWAPLLGTVWLFDVTLEPGEEVPITHEYRVPSTVDSSGGLAADYVTRTGALWGRPIGRARFTFRYPARVCDLLAPDLASDSAAQIPFASFRITESEGELLGEASYEIRDWTPKNDVTFYMRPCVAARGSWNDKHETACPLQEGLTQFAYPRSAYDHAEETPPTHDELVRELAKLSDEQLRNCKNYPFAVYGRPFADAALSEAFYGNAKPTLSAGPLKPFQPSSHYTDKLLTPGDWRWIKVVDEVLKQRPAAVAKAEPAAGPDVAKAEAPPAAPVAAPPPAAKAGCSGCAVGGGGEAWQGWLALLGLSLTVSSLRRRPSRQPARCRRP